MSGLFFDADRFAVCIEFDDTVCARIFDVVTENDRTAFCFDAFDRV